MFTNKIINNTTNIKYIRLCHSHSNKLHVAAKQYNTISHQHKTYLLINTQYNNNNIIYNRLYFTTDNSSSDSNVKTVTANTETIKPIEDSKTNTEQPHYTILRMLDDMGSGKITKWRVAIGDYIESGQTICDIDTDIAEIEYNAQYGGYIGAILVDENKHVNPNTELAIQVDSKDAVEFAQQIAKQLKS